MVTLNQLLNVPSADPDDARRRRLLNILLISIAVMTALILLAVILVATAGLEEFQMQGLTLPIACLLTLVGVVIIYAINRYWSGQFAGALLLLILIVVSGFTDTPRNVVEGRSLFLFTIPILMASVILLPWASFIVAGLSSLVVSVIALNALQAVPPVPTILGFFSVALVAWLSARSLEDALRDLRILNLELDQRVQERTRELAAAFSRNQAILEGIADGVIVFDNTGQAIVANPAIASLLEQPADKITGRNIETLIAEKMNAADQETLVALLKNRETHHPSIKFEWGEKTLSASVAPVHVASGKEIGTVAVFRDFTREARIDLMKSTFVSIASHELRTPLNAILGYADMLQENVYGPLSERQSGVLERIVANTGHLLSLVGNLLDQAQIEAGTLTLNALPLVPSDLVKDVLGVMDVLAQPKGLELTSHVADDLPPTLLGDRRRLQQILINLVGNAIKFTEEGKVHVQTYRADETHWVLEVSDTGRGISPEAQTYIFEPFRQADEPLVREYTGAGLGLSIVKQLTDMMGGRIELESELGRGSTFTIVLPIALPAYV
jgi:PAS domain S-box-containing protein